MIHPLFSLARMVFVGTFLLTVASVGPCLAQASKADDSAATTDHTTANPTAPASPIDWTQSPLNICFLGDSITHSGDYHAMIQLFLLTRYPGRDIWTINGGYAGENATGILRKNYLQLDIFPQKPNVIMIHLGMNDIGLLGFDNVTQPPSDESRKSRRDDFRNAMTTLIKESQAQGVTVGVLSPTIYDDRHTNNDSHGLRPLANAELALFGRIGREVAESIPGVFFIDLHTPMNNLSNALQDKDPKASLARDRVHPFQGGTQVMTFEILKGLGVRDQVYDITLNASGKTLAVSGAEVREVKAQDHGLSFTTIESALPFPTQAASKYFKLVPMDETLNRMRLKVADLPAGKYALKIDGQAVGEFASDELAKGIALEANDATPQYQAALALLKQVEEKMKYQRAICDMRSLRFQLLIKKEPEGQGLVWEWDRIEPAKVLDAANRLYDRLEAEGKKPKGWQSYVFNAGRKACAEYGQITTGLADLRKQWAAQPAQREHHYHLLPARQ